MEYLNLQEISGKEVNWERVDQSDRLMLIPSHSHLFGAWVDHGILGGIFWSYMLYIMIKAMGAGIFGIKTTKPLEFLQSH